MDLVLVCEKNTLPVVPLSLDPEDIFQRVQENFKEDLNDTENKWFLRFMGELLRAASASPEKVTYEWFYNSLVYFSHRWKQMLPEEYLLPSRPPEPAQMRLFEK